MLATNQECARDIDGVSQKADRTSGRAGAGTHAVDLSLESEWALGSTRRIAAKGYLFREGDEKLHVYKVTSGGICLYRISTDGRRQVIDFAFEGDIVGLGFALTEGCNAQAIAPTGLKCVPIAFLLSAARQDCGVALRLFEAISRELVATREHLQCVGKRGATERLAIFLVLLSRRNLARGEDPLSIELPMTRADIADFLGLTIETVSRSFTKLKCQGKIDIDRNTTIHLRDPIGLAEMAEGAERI